MSFPVHPQVTCGFVPITSDVNLDHLVKMVFVRFLHGKAIRYS